MLANNEYNTIKVSGGFFPLIPLGVEIEANIYCVERKILDFQTEKFLTSDKWKTIDNLAVSDNILMQSINRQKYAIDGIESENSFSRFLTLFQTFELINNEGITKVCKCLEVTNTDIAQSSFKKVTITYVELEIDTVSIISYNRSDILAIERSTSDLFSLNFVNAKGYKTQYCFAIDVSGETGKHTFNVDISEFSNIEVGDNVLITSFDKRNIEAISQTGTIISITNQIALIQFDTLLAFYDDYISFEFSHVGKNVVNLNYYTSILPKITASEPLKNENNIQGINYSRNIVTFDKNTLKLCLSDRDLTIFIRYYDRCDLYFYDPISAKTILLQTKQPFELSKNGEMVNYNEINVNLLSNRISI